VKLAGLVRKSANARVRSFTLHEGSRGIIEWFGLRGALVESFHQWPCIIKNEKVERLPRMLAHMTGETKAAAICVRWQSEGTDRPGSVGKASVGSDTGLSRESNLAQHFPENFWGAMLPGEKSERILGYGKGGV